MVGSRGREGGGQGVVGWGSGVGICIQLKSKYEIEYCGVNLTDYKLQN